MDNTEATGQAGSAAPRAKRRVLNMRLALKRVGNIKEAMICIDSVTTLAGPNNSGKTTVSKALDATACADD